VAGHRLHPLPESEGPSPVEHTEQLLREVAVP